MECKCAFFIASLMVLYFVGAAPTAEQKSDGEVNYSDIQELLNKYREREGNERVEETPGEEFWEDLIDSLPSIKEYLHMLDQCVFIVKDLKIIESSFHYAYEDKTSLELSQVSLCRLAVTLNQALITEQNKENTLSQVEQLLGDSARSTEYKLSTDKRVLDRIGSGPLELKRAMDRIGNGPIELKRGMDRIGAGPMELKRGMDRIGAGPMELKRGLDRIGAGPMELKRGMDSVEDAHVAAQSSESNDDLLQVLAKRLLSNK